MSIEPKAYQPKDVEKEIYILWEENKLFQSQINFHKKAYCIMLPPPNITGSLHMGHALDGTLQDILIRLKRMQGFEALWVPGTDHAGIATQMVVEKELLKKGLNKKELGKENFIKEIWSWKEKYGGTIVHQLKRLGISCDWERERFTLDEICSKAVREAFVRLFEKGYIYKGKQIINWCPRCQTALSDLEVKHQEILGKLYYVRYYFEDKNNFITVATTRPETILADSAVAVNTKDERFKKFIGKKVFIPIINRLIPVIKDERVNLEFGTGALKVTPAHDPVDYLIGKDHKLLEIAVIDEAGKMNKNAGQYQGLERFQCRENFAKDLEKIGALEKIEDYQHSPGYCERCNTIIEPYLSSQWFMSMDELVKPAISALKEGKIKFIPERFSRIYLYWMENIRDWCISRQLWWGHPIPVWECKDCKKFLAYREDPKICKSCGSANISSDPDVLDTWFSSGLWPFSTLGWPENTPELKYYYPTSSLLTAREIIFLWVARMIIFGLEFMRDIPFKEVYIHSTILNQEGRRMSKSLGTGIDPLELFDKYGVDATRFGLTLETEQGQDIWFSEERLNLARNFANKIWNASRFILQNTKDYENNHSVESYSLNFIDKWILSALQRVIKEVSSCLEVYEFAVSARILYDFFWDDFCNWYLEIAKLFLIKEKEKTQKILIFVLENFLKLLHPFMPHLSEKIWQIKEEKSFLINSPWPEINLNLIFNEEESQFNLLRKFIRGIRNLRSEIKINPANKIKIEILGEENLIKEIFQFKELIFSLAGVSEIKEISQRPKFALSFVLETLEVFLPLEKDLLNQEILRKEKELEDLEKNIERINQKLKNQDFLTKAPLEVLEKEKNKLKNYNLLKNKIKERLKDLQ